MHSTRVIMDEMTIHPDNLPENQVVSNKERVEREAKFRGQIAHLPLRKQRKLLAKVGLDTPVVAQHTPQMALSRRDRRKSAREAAKQPITAQVVQMRPTPAIDTLMAVLGHNVQTGIPVEVGVDPSYDQMTLKQLRTVAQGREIRVDGKRPSLCTKAELLVALA